MEKIKQVDETVIKNIKFKYPQIMNDNAEDIIRNVHKVIIDTEEQLYQAREEVIKLEKALKKYKEAFSEMITTCEIEYDIKTIEYSTNKTNLRISGQGNDTLGTFSN